MCYSQLFRNVDQAHVPDDNQEQNEVATEISKALSQPVDNHAGA